MLNYFTLFSLDIHYDIDLKILDNLYFDMQLKYHPDSLGDRDQSVDEMVNIMDINDGYKVLKDDFLRAKHILSLNNIAIDEDADSSQTIVKANHNILINVLEDRQKLDDINHQDELNDYLIEIKSKKEQVILAIKDWMQKRDIGDAVAQKAIELRYLNKLSEAIESKIIKLTV